MKYYIIAGEASGDLHGSNLIKHLHLLDVNATIKCWGGDLMEQAGATVVKHYRDLAFMGFVEVIFNLRTILKNLTFCKEDIQSFKPDVIIFIDFPGFNLKIAEWAKHHQYKSVYYISPQIWAWKESRIKTIKKCVDKMLVILPFEENYYKNLGYKVDYVGHPLIEVIEDFKKNTTNSSSISTKKIVALLPGSRKQEIKKKLPVMLEVSKSFPSYQFVIAKSPGLEDDFYQPFLEGFENVSAVKNKTYQLLNDATAALVTSGTATLETALFGVPEVVCYKANPISYAIAKQIVRIKYISLVNLIMDKLVVKELIQSNFTVENCTKELTDLLEKPARIQQLKQDYAALNKLLSLGGHASSNAANIIYNFLLSA
jgi:lipid-A-disaccharide synthase